MVSPAQIQRCLDERKSLLEIATELGISGEAVKYRIRAHGLKRTLPLKSLRRRAVSRPEHIKPATRHTVHRECITCSEPFTSTGQGHRMCSRCRHLSEDHIFSISGASKK
jgi:hypothetical protein